MNIYPTIGLEQDNQEWLSEYDWLTQMNLQDTPQMKRVERILQKRLGPDFEYVVRQDREVLL